MSEPAPHTAHSNRSVERGFSLVEVIVAMIVVAIVLSSAAAAVVSSDSATSRTQGVADSHAIAEKAMERAREDLTNRSSCNAGGWIATGRQKKVSGSGTQTTFSTCQVDYNDMLDAKGRRYLVSLRIQPKDSPADGFGASDTDGDLRDSYDVTTTVVLATGSRAGRENQQPVRVAGTVDWKGGTVDDATVTVIACAIDRPDRSLMAGNCSNSDQSRRQVTTTVTVRRVIEETGGTSTAGTITSGTTPTALPPGSYRFQAASSVSIGGATFDLFKLDPADLRILGSRKYVLHATYVRRSMTTTVCTQIVNWTPSYDDGYEVRATNIYYRRTGQPAYRRNRIVMNWNRSWNCTGVDIGLKPGQNPPAMERTGNGDHRLRDPLDPTDDLFRGVYDLEVEEVNRRVPNYDAGLRVYQAVLNCSLDAWNDTNIGGTPLYTRTRDANDDRPGSTNTTTRLSRFFRMPITANAGGQRLCLRFTSRQVARVVCQEPNEEAPGCQYSTTTCTLPAGTVDNDNDCWNGAEVCVSNCSSGGSTPSGTAGSVELSSTSGGVSGGPNDTTVACTTQSTYSWPGSRLYGAGMSVLQPMSTILAHTWVGGDSYYYSNFNGKTMARKSHPYGVHPDAFTYNLPDHPTYHCNDVYFTAPKSMLTGSWKLYTCIEVHVPGRPHLRIRGRILDQSGLTGSTLYTTVGGALVLAPDSSKMQNHWNPFGGANSYPLVTSGSAYNWPVYNVAKVSGDPVCNSGGGPVYEHVDPIIDEIWNRPWNDPMHYPLPLGPNDPRLGTDRVGV